jgi:hypothetical protein
MGDKTVIPTGRKALWNNILNAESGWGEREEEREREVCVTTHLRILS